jgi:hypothetical protein
VLTFPAWRLDAPALDWTLTILLSAGIVMASLAVPVSGTPATTARSFPHVRGPPDPSRAVNGSGPVPPGTLSRPSGGTGPYHYVDLEGLAFANDWIRIDALAGSHQGIWLTSERPGNNGISRYDPQTGVLTDLTLSLPAGFLSPSVNLTSLAPLPSGVFIAGEQGPHAVWGILNDSGTFWNLSRVAPPVLGGNPAPDFGPAVAEGAIVILGWNSPHGPGLAWLEPSSGLALNVTSALPANSTRIVGVGNGSAWGTNTFVVWAQTTQGPRLGLVNSSHTFQPIGSFPSSWVSAGSQATALGVWGGSAYVALEAPSATPLLGEVSNRSGSSATITNLTPDLGPYETCSGCELSELQPDPSGGLFVLGTNNVLFSIPVAIAGYLNVSSGTYVSLSNRINQGILAPDPHIAGVAYANGTDLFGGGGSSETPGAQLGALNVSRVFSAPSDALSPLEDLYSPAPDYQTVSSMYTNCTVLLGGATWQAPAVASLEPCTGTFGPVAPPASWVENGTSISDLASGAGLFLAAGTLTELDPHPLLGVYIPGDRGWTVMEALAPPGVRGYYMGAYGGGGFLLAGYDFQYNGVVDFLNMSSYQVYSVSSHIAVYNTSWWGDAFNGTSFLLAGNALVNCALNGSVVGGEVEFAQFTPRTNTSSMLGTQCVQGVTLAWSTLVNETDYLVGEWGALSNPQNPYFASYDPATGRYVNLSDLMPPGFHPRTVAGWNGDIWIAGSQGPQAAPTLLAYDPSRELLSPETSWLPSPETGSPRTSIDALGGCRMGLVVAGLGFLGVLENYETLVTVQARANISGSGVLVPVPDANVTVVPEGAAGPILSFGTTNLTGEALLGPFTNGTYELVVRSSGYYEGVQSLTILTSPPPRAPITVLLTPRTWQLTGFAVNSQTHQPLSRGEVTIVSGNWLAVAGCSFPASINGSGGFLLCGLVNGTYGILLEAPGYFSLATNITVQGQNFSGRFPLEPLPPPPTPRSWTATLEGVTLVTVCGLVAGVLWTLWRRRERREPPPSAVGPPPADSGGSSSVPPPIEMERQGGPREGQ